MTQGTNNPIDEQPVTEQPVEEQRGGRPAQPLTPTELDELFEEPTQGEGAPQDAPAATVTLQKQRTWGENEEEE